MTDSTRVAIPHLEKQGGWRMPVKRSHIELENVADPHVGRLEEMKVRMSLKSRIHPKSLNLYPYLDQTRVESEAGNGADDTRLLSFTKAGAPRLRWSDVRPELDNGRLMGFKQGLEQGDEQQAMPRVVLRNKRPPTLRMNYDQQVRVMAANENGYRAVDPAIFNRVRRRKVAQGDTHGETAYQRGYEQFVNPSIRQGAGDALPFNAPTSVPFSDSMLVNGKMQGVVNTTMYNV